jgi:Kef-type K+ transport system membrane component KefB
MPHIELSPISMVFAEICVVLLLSRVLCIAMRVLGQPSVIAEIVAGIILGPSVLGLLWPQLSGLLFPEAAVAGLRQVSQLGLVLFMFLVGLELDPTAFKGRASAVVFISHVSIAVPFALGAASALWLWPRYSEPHVPLGVFAMFLGVAMSVTAFPVLARILSEQSLSASRVGGIAMACAAIDDITAWCLLALVVASARARSPADGLWTAALALLFVLFMWQLMRRALRRLGRTIERPEQLTPAVLAVILMLVIACSLATELIGIHALFGAFAFGAAMPKQSEVVKGLTEKLETVTVLLLLPLFFAYSGLRTQIGLLSRPEDWLVTLAVVIIATAGKAGGGALAARISGFRWREAGTIGVLMNTRGLMELVVLNAGMDLGLISPRIFTMLVIMALVTTCATTPLVRRLNPSVAPLTMGPGEARDIPAGVQP